MSANKEGLKLEDFENNNSQSNLKKLKKQVEEKRKDFFAKRKDFFATHIDETHIAAYIRKKLKDNPFKDCDVDEKTIRRWITGESPIKRFAAYQICIALEWDSEIFEEFFKELAIDRVRFNDWRDVVYLYCIEKGHNLHQAHEFFKQCIAMGLDEDTGELKIDEPIATMTTVIRNAYYLTSFDNDTDFLNYIKEHKYKFHRIRKTRQEEIIKYLDELKVPDDEIPQLFANAFCPYNPAAINQRNDYTYFSNVIKTIRKREKNFSRDFFILCLLVKGINNADEIKEILTAERRDYPDLDPTNNLFDACVYESCKYSERNKNTTAYDRFCDNTQFLEYIRPSEFAYD